MNQKSIDFNNRLIKNVISIIKTFQLLEKNEANHIFFKQIVRSSSSIGANFQESQVSQSKKEFIAKLNISLKEANETLYWLELTESLNNKNFSANKIESLEIIKILTSIIKTSNKRKTEQI